MKKLIISSLAMAVIVSCSSSNDNPEDNNNNNNSNTPYLLKKFTEVTPDGQSYVVEYKYDGNKITESFDVTDNEKEIYTYDGDNIIKTELFRNGVMKYMREFTYSNGRLVSEKVTDKEQAGTLIYTENYQYLSDNHVRYNDYSSATYNPSTGTYSNIQYVQKDVYLNSNGNMASFSYTNNGTTYNTTFLYDSNNHPMKNVKGFVKMEMFSLDDGEMAYNNLLNSNGSYSGTVSGTRSSSGVHTLNSSDYPTKSVMTYNSSVLGTNKHTYLYEYNK